MLRDVQQGLRNLIGLVVPKTYPPQPIEDLETMSYQLI